jgi:hypothetical protein
MTLQIPNTQTSEYNRVYLEATLRKIQDYINTTEATTSKTGGYTVATLPAGVIGMRAYVTDATAPTYLGALTGGGAVKCPVFHNGTAWISA